MTRDPDDMRASKPKAIQRRPVRFGDALPTLTELRDRLATPETGKDANEHE